MLVFAHTQFQGFIKSPWKNVFKSRQRYFLNAALILQENKHNNHFRKSGLAVQFPMGKQASQHGKCIYSTASREQQDLLPPLKG